jgi:hypothetical protein
MKPFWHDRSDLTTKDNSACIVQPGRVARYVVLPAIALACLPAQAAGAATLNFSTTPSTTQPYDVCPSVTVGHAKCLSIISPATHSQASAVAPSEIEPGYSGSGVGGGYSPANLRSAYNLPSTSGGSGQTVAVVDAYNDPNAESDLAAYRSYYGLPACGSGCFTKINQTGGTSYPESEPHWAVEISLDLDMVSAACPNCHILLVEATTNSFANLGAAEDEAVSRGASEISNSWGSDQFSGETSYNSYFNHPGVPTTFSAGDHGYEVEYPAASPYVIAVGGTSLTPAANSRGWSETAWTGTGSGCSAYETKPAWQTDAGCSHRTNNDVSAVANPETPVSVYDSYEEPDWMLVGGTSAASPLIAGTMALAEGYTRSLGAAAFYDDPAALYDVTSGSNGSCGGSYLCTAGAGYDGPTGLGTPDGAPHVAPAEVESSSSWAVRDPNSRSQYVYYANSNGGISYWSFISGTGWTDNTLGGHIASGTVPSVVLSPATGAQYVYYVNSSNEIATFADVPGSGWSGAVLGGHVATDTSPTVSSSPSSGDQYLYYVNTSHEIVTMAYVDGWSTANLGGHVAADTSPTAVGNLASGTQYVYYVNSSHEVVTFTYVDGWTTADLGGRVAADSSVTSLVGPSTGAQYLYYVNSSDEIATFAYVDGWSSGTLGGDAEGGTTPTVVRDPGSGNQYLYYVNAGDEMVTMAYLDGWSTADLGGQVAAGTSPSVVGDPVEGATYVYYTRSANGATASFSWTPTTGWLDSEL